ncbi:MULTISPECIES: GntR family transcriptional regulator [unclassified Crossiella]|uniref:GntR family transcriptional regulator n=1 Tax=unclassified Crossiella TaxID=2620835 RepID=UPI001FFFE262|nr:MULTISPECIES: GntR family transcriptional regulator [unclassified Crossiella]MCK2237450.1 GntR family transcriptional regulator [Crossiella sp. S99.2]MCK2251105.1 GntR family transcriptional regulator [Crossiella sp. S99.1]
MIEFRIDRHSGVATYLQIAAQVKQAMRMGLLGPGDQLPTAREVVAATTVNPNTVLKAYRELEHEGLVAGRRGMGTFVTASLATDAVKLGAPLRQDLEQWMGRAVTDGLVLEEVDAIYTDVRDTHYPA